MNKKEKKASGFKLSVDNPLQILWLVVGLLAFVVVVQFLNNLRFAEALRGASEAKPSELFLPEQNSDIDTVVTAEDDPIVDLFAYVEKLGSEGQEGANRSRQQANLTAYLTAPETLSAWQNQGLKLQSGLHHDLIDTQNATVFLTIELDEVGTLRLKRQSDQSGEVDLLFTLSDPDQFETFKQKIAEVIAADLESHRAQVVESAANQKQTIDELREKLEALKSDAGFQALIQKYGMTWGGPTEDDFYVFYELRGPDNLVMRIIVLDKVTGEISVREPDRDSPLSSAQMSRPPRDSLVLLKDLVRSGDDDIAFLLPSADDLTQNNATQDKKDVNLLIAGKSGSNVDTIIFANIDPSREKITLLSIPRDLYYKGRKINSVYATEGIKQLTKDLSDITGYKIGDYVLVDMIVFKDLIDLVGGVDVTLESDLVDPTYKVFRNGVASTLHYSAGDHHLDGSEALRIARSRYSTSDYSRAERQQIILEALKIKAQTLGAQDLPTLFKLLKTTLAKTETSLRLDEVARYYLGYKDFTLARGNVLSSGNVLKSTLMPVDYNTSLRVEICQVEDAGQPAGQTITKVPLTQTTPNNPACAIKNAIYTLEPRDGNWDYIKWYVRKAVE